MVSKSFTYDRSKRRGQTGILPAGKITQGRFFAQGRVRSLKRAGNDPGSSMGGNLLLIGLKRASGECSQDVRWLELTVRRTIATLRARRPQSMSWRNLEFRWPINC